MKSKKRWIITSAAALLFAVGGTTAFVASTAAPMTHEEGIKRAEEKFGTAPAKPTGELPQENPGDPLTMPTGEGLKETLGQAAATSDWAKAERLKQEATFAEHAPSPMPTGHSSEVVAGNKP